MSYTVEKSSQRKRKAVVILIESPREPEHTADSRGKVSMVDSLLPVGEATATDRQVREHVDDLERSCKRANGWLRWKVLAPIECSLTAAPIALAVVSVGLLHSHT